VMDSWKNGDVLCKVQNIDDAWGQNTGDGISIRSLACYLYRPNYYKDGLYFVACCKFSLIFKNRCRCLHPTGQNLHRLCPCLSINCILFPSFTVAAACRERVAARV
jgi:hypothetical protein